MWKTVFFKSRLISKCADLKMWKTGFFLNQGWFQNVFCCNQGEFQGWLKINIDFMGYLKNRGWYQNVPEPANYNYFLTARNITNKNKMQFHREPILIINWQVNMLGVKHKDQNSANFATKSIYFSFYKIMSLLCKIKKSNFYLLQQKS